MVVGQLVKEELHNRSPRIGTVVKVSEIILSETSHWRANLENYQRRGQEYYNPLIRPGNVVTVRWQDDPTRVTIHAFYIDCLESHYNHGSNTVTMVK